MTVVRALRIVVAAALLGTTLGGASPQGRLAFLDKGEVWVLSVPRSDSQRQTRTGRRVEDFRFSGDGQYLAYAKRLRPADGRWICSIVIVNATTRALVKEIRPDDGWIDIDKWLGTRLVYHSSAAMEVSGVFEFDAIRRTSRKLESEAGYRTLDSDVARDGSLAYVDDAGLGPTYEQRLHFIDAVTDTDTVLVAKRSVMAPVISPTVEAVTFVEVFGEKENVRDHVWVYRRTDRSLKMVDDDRVRPKSAGSGLAWSPDSRYISINFGGDVTVVDFAGTSSPRRFRGADACWSGTGTMVVQSMGRLDAIDVVSGTHQSLVASGTRPQCLNALAK